MVAQTDTRSRRFVGQKQRKRRKRGLSEYGRMLREKQELRDLYRLRERQFRRYVEETLESGSRDIADQLVKRLERRLDNAIYRLGIAETRGQARQLVSHGHVLVNERKVDIPSFQVSEGDVLEIKQRSKDAGIFQGIEKRLEKYQPPSWLQLDGKNMRGQVTGQPTAEETQPPVQISMIFEFYAR